MDFKQFSKLIMIEQTTFALPFAYLGILFAGGGAPRHWLWCTLALAAARTAGMSFNRVLDADIDAKNPRTAERLIPAGDVAVRSVWFIAALSCLILVFSSYMLNDLVFYLSFAALFLLFTYSLFKRFSASSHLYLGIVEAAAPVGGYLAVTGRFDLLALIPGAAIMFWIAGIDILYAIQDLDFDRRQGLYSIPARFGRGRSFLLSRIFYVSSVAALFLAGLLGHMTSAYWLSLPAVAFIFIWQQVLASQKNMPFEDQMKKVFSLNRFVAPVIFAGALIDVLICNYF